MVKVRLEDQYTLKKETSVTMNNILMMVGTGQTRKETNATFMKQWKQQM